MTFSCSNEIQLNQADSSLTSMLKIQRYCTYLIPVRLKLVQVRIFTGDFSNLVRKNGKYVYQSVKIMCDIVMNCDPLVESYQLSTVS